MIAHIEVCEAGEHIVTHERVTADYTLEMMREDYAGATVVATCNCPRATIRRDTAWDSEAKA